MKKCIVFCFLLVVVACSPPKKNQDLSTVSIATESNSEIKIDPAIDRNPIQENMDKNAVEKEKPKPVSLIIYPSLYSSLGLIDFLKQAQKNQLKISHMVCHGFSFLLCALYARDENLSTVEWKLFALLKKLGEYKVYSKGWLSEIEKFATEEFKKNKLSSFKVKLTYLSNDSNEKRWVNDKEIVQAILDNLSLYNKKNYLLKPDIFDHQLREIPGIKNIYSLVFLSTKLKIDIQDEYVWGIMTNYLSFVSKHQNVQQLMSSTNLTLDKLYPVSKYESQFSAANSTQLEKILTDLKSSEEINSASSI